MRRLVFWIIALLAAFLFGFLVCPCPVRADTLYLPIIRGGYVVSVTGRAEWEGDAGPVAHRQFALLEVVSDNPLIFRHNSDSPHATTDAEGRFAFRGVKDGTYVLAIEWHPPFGWRLLWGPDEWALYLVVVEGESVEMGVVRVGIGHLWGE